MEKRIESALQKILSDKTSGSADLLLLLNKFFINNFTSIEDPLLLIKSLQIHFRSFQNIQQYLGKISKSICNGTLTIDFFYSFINNNSNAFNNIFINAFPFLKDKTEILTLSNSRTVFEVVKRLRTTNHKLHLIVSESRPKFEGRVLTQKLLNQNIRTTLITEAMFAKYIACCDCVLIGTDAVLKNKSIVNKIGSLQLAILCKHYSKPFYVVANKSKISSQKMHKQNVESKDEIWKNAPAKITINNLYFETVPKRLITRIITD
jgi:translation initiation factor 2B subunit (eIF-2B alpha/beta/delta family)